MLKFLLASGIMQSRPLLTFFRNRYPFKESSALYAALIGGLGRMSRNYLWQQLQTLFAPVPPLTVQPDLRIHARPDTIVFAPDEPFIEVPGDHFALVFHAERVAEPIRALLTNRTKSSVA